MKAEAINAMLAGRVKDLASRRAASSVTDHALRVRDDTETLLKCLGLSPFPAKTDLKALVMGTIRRDGYKIEKLVFESRPGFFVTGHLYLPDTLEPAPLILRPHGHWSHKKSEPAVQASGIGLALSGYAVAVIDSPGSYGETPPQNERAAQGPHNDPWLCMGLPLTGFYVWDLVCALDYLSTRPEIDSKRVGITGASGGGLAAMYAFAIDQRISCAVPVCYASSLRIEPHNGCLCNHVPGVLGIGDRSDVLALRAPAPIFVIGATDDSEFPEAGTRKTYEELKTIYKLFGKESNVRFEIVESQHDYNRRMRESALAFFDEHLRGRPHLQYKPEPRPITDGALNPYPAQTVPAEDPELLVFPDGPPGTATMRSFVDPLLVNAFPNKYDPLARLVPWAKYGKLLHRATDGRLVLHDEEIDADKLEMRLCIYLGISIPELWAQLLHLSLPGGPEGWELSALGPTGDVLTSLIGSMKALVHSSESQGELSSVTATGPISSMAAVFLKALRPGIEVSVSHGWKSWEELYAAQDPHLVQPMARYLGWPGA